MSSLDDFKAGQNKAELQSCMTKLQYLIPSYISTPIMNYITINELAACTRTRNIHCLFFTPNSRAPVQP